MQISERALRSIEQIQEDERLRGDLEDRAATALVAWASALAASIADDPQRSDSEVEAAVQAIRSAARSASQSGANQPEQVVAAAEAITHSTYAAILTIPSGDQVAGSSVETAEDTVVQPKQLKRSQGTEPEQTKLAPDDQRASSNDQGLIRSLLERLNKPESQDV